MAKVSVQERIDDICSRSGLSEAIVRRVLEAERQSIIDSLKRGEKAQLIGRCTFIPSEGARLEVGGTVKKSIRVKCRPAIGLVNELDKENGFIEIKDETQNREDDGIRIAQIDALLG